MPEFMCIETRGEVAVVHIDRPPANAFDVATLEEAARTLEEVRAADPGAVVITGRDGFFSAGVDLKFAVQQDREGQRRLVTGLNRAFADLYSLPRPVVCAVNGHAIAGGLILALCGDYRVCSTEGKLGLTELRAGIPYPVVALAVVKAELSPQAARLLVLRAELIDPRAALELGIVDELAEPPAVLDRALEVAGELARLPHSVYAQVKRHLRAETIAAARAAVEDESDPLLGGWFGSETARAAAQILERG